MGRLVAFPNGGGNPPSAQAPRERSFAIPALVVLALMLLGLVVAITQHRADALFDVPLEARELIVRRSLLEMRSTCRESYAARGPLRDHCIEVARFVVRFSECRSECQAAVNAVLPHAHR
jgi:hypothetical protein